MEPNTGLGGEEESRRPGRERRETGISKAAREALNEAGDDTDLACEILIATVNGNDELHQELMMAAIREAIASAVRERREVIWKSTPEIERAHKRANDRIHARAEVTESLLLDFPLPGGQLLRNSTREEILEAADTYSLKATDMAYKGRWLGAVGKLVPEGKVAGAVLTEKKLRDLKKKVEFPEEG